jgi:predicted Zn-dependent protease
MLSSFKLQLNKPQEAIALLRQTVVGDPNIAESWWRLVLTYRLAGDTASARRTAIDAVKRGLVFDGQGQQVIDEAMAVGTSTVVIKK